MDENNIEFFNENSPKDELSGLTYKNKPNLSTSILALILVAIVFIILSTDHSGFFLIMILPIMFVVLPVLFIILALRNYRCKNKVHLLDKLTFFILMLLLIGLFIYAISTVR